jgi:hypothetical protein
MNRTIRCVLAAIVLLQHTSVAVSSTAPSLCHLSFYTCLHGGVNPSLGFYNCYDWGFIPSLQAGWVSTGFTNDTTLVRAGSSAGIASMLYIGDTFFDFGHGLRPDYAHRWEAQAAEVEQLIKSGNIVGFFVGDELVSAKHITWGDIATAVRTLSSLMKQYPHLFVWQNEGGASRWWEKLPNGTLPSEIDVISIDAYSLSPNETREWYKKNLYPVLNPVTQRVFIVPGSFGSRVDPNKTLGQFTTEMVANANAYHQVSGRSKCLDACSVNKVRLVVSAHCTCYTETQWALADPMVYGIVPWHWEARKVGQTSAYKEVGTSEMPLLIAAWTAIGKDVLARRAAGKCASFPPNASPSV